LRGLSVGPVAVSGKIPGGDGKEPRRVVALLSEEPAGRISTSNAGAISFEATLKWRPDDGIPARLVLDGLAPGARFYSLVQAEDTVSAVRRVSCEVRAFYAKQLTSALDVLLRSVTTHAAQSEAVLEARTVRLADPAVTSATLVEALARQLWDAGFPVSFGPSWKPALDADVSIGTRGLEEDFEAFLLTRPAWKLPPPR
jgi:hypothetical protein